MKSKKLRWIFTSIKVAFFIKKSIIVTCGKNFKTMFSAPPHTNINTHGFSFVTDTGMCMSLQYYC